MNTFTYQTIRAGLVFVVAFFMAANTAFASAVLIPAGASEITTSSAVLNSQVVNANSNSFVWFEWADNASFSNPFIAGKQAFWGGRSFEAAIDGLKPGTTYYYRAIAIARPISGSAEAPVYSSIVSFKTKTAGGDTNGNGGTVYGTTQNTNTGGTSNTNTNTTTSNTTNTTNTTNTNTTSSQSSTKNNTVATVTTDGFTRTGVSSASVIVAGDGLLPGTLIGWILLFIALFVVLLIVRLIYEQSEKRKKARLVKQVIVLEEDETKTNGLAAA